MGGLDSAGTPLDVFAGPFDIPADPAHRVATGEEDPAKQRRQDEAGNGLVVRFHGIFPFVVLVSGFLPGQESGAGAPPSDYR
jgi:hypothetical protein